jgi:uncharacterized integral membrane protein
MNGRFAYQKSKRGDLTPDGRWSNNPTGSDPTPTGRAVPRSRIGGLWVACVLFAFVLLLLLIFVLQNGQRAEVSFFGAHGHLPMGVALLLAAVFGILLVALPGTARIVQLRMFGRRRSPPADTRPAADATAGPAADDPHDADAAPLTHQDG